MIFTSKTGDVSMAMGTVMPPILLSHPCTAVFMTPRFIHESAAVLAMAECGGGMLGLTEVIWGEEMNCIDVIFDLSYVINVCG